VTRNGHPHQRFDPQADPCAQTLIDRFRIAPRELPIVLCPDGRLLRNPSDVELARCIGLVKPIDPGKTYDVVIIGAGQGLARNIVDYREAHGPFRTRAVLKKVPRLGPKAFELSAGFLRIRDGDDPLDASGVHPEAYPVVRRILAATRSELKQRPTRARPLLSPGAGGASSRCILRPNCCPSCRRPSCRN
jgi:hypothetical protein